MSSLHECVANAASNRFVRCQLETFCNQCGYGLSETVLRLEDVWVSKRERWWAVLMVTSLGKLHLRGFVPGPFPAAVKDVMPRALSLDPSEAQQLVLSPDEYVKMSKYTDLTKLVLPRSGKCPTALHSWGAQVTACSCGCRNASFSESSLATRGIYGVVIPIDDSVTDVNGKEVPSFRHLHPSELAILTGVPLPQEWPSSLRLILTGLGQQAAPFQALWVAGQVHRHLDSIFGIEPAFVVETAFETLMKIVIDQAKDLFDESSEESEVAVRCVPGKVSKEVSPSLPQWVVSSHDGPPQSVTVQFQHSGCKDVVRLSSPQATVGNLRAAEVQINPTAELWDFVDCASGSVLSTEESIANKCLFVRPCTLTLADIEISHVDKEEQVVECAHQSVPDGSVMISPTAPFSVDVPATSGPVQVDPLTLLTPKQLQEVPLPQVNSYEVFRALRSQKMHPANRKQVALHQGSLWADDEICWHLQEIIRKSGTDKWTFLDPLLASEAVHRRSQFQINAWYQQCSKDVKGIVSCVLVHGHWVPFAWTWTSQLLVCRSWDVMRPNALNLNFLHEAIALVVGAASWTTHVIHRAFAADGHCGLCAVRFLDSEIRGKMLPASRQEVEVLHQTGRDMFIGFLESQTECTRPWVWGDGLDPHAHRRLTELMVQHGVPSEVTENRVSLLIQAVGLAPIQKAVIGTSPWRAVKAVANQSRPPFQLVLPDELENAIKAKAAAGGQQTKRKKGMGKGTFNRPPLLDASKLKLEPGYFVKQDGTAVRSLSISQLGPFAEGVAIATLAQVEQFLSSEKSVSQFPLAVVVINCDESGVTTSLPRAQQRVPVRCVLNDDPMLVQAWVVQLGSSFLTTVKGDVVEVDMTKAACVKVAAYRDSIVGTWSDFVSGPIRYVLEHLSVLLVCEAESCTCEKWHPENHDKLKDPILDVWRRPWLSMAFKPVAPEVAEIFLVNVRYAQQLESLVLSCSGPQGVFLEPRSLDGRSPVLDWQVLWLHRYGLKDVLHIKQCQAHVTGAVRLGSRFGVRVHSDHAVEVGARLKPDTVMLAAGPKMDFELGPIPFGSDRVAIHRLCKQWKWQARAINPIRTLDNSTGMMWHVQAACDPPAQLFMTQMGEVVVARMPPKVTPGMSKPGTIGTSKTVGLCSMGSNEAEDPWANYKDPWSTGLKKVVPTTPVDDPSVVLRQVEERIEKAVLAKLPQKPQSENMEVDACSGVDTAATEARFQSVEAHIQQLVQHQQSLDAKIDSNAKKVDAQVNQLQCQVVAQIDAQSNKMEDMFSKQMDQISMLLAKRARME